MPSSQYQTFAALHRKGQPFVLGNSWNVNTAKLFEKNGYKAIATSSAAIARSLGYEDGENIPFSELLFMVEKIKAATSLPLSVDLETGYGKDHNTIIRNIEQLLSLGVAGINLEDSVDGKLISPFEFSLKLEAIRNHLVKNNLQLFINARTDAFLFNLPDPMITTLERSKTYEKAGADGLFVPFISSPADILQVSSATSLPLNVLCMLNLPSFDILAKAGVARISLGSTAFRSVDNYFETVIRKVRELQSASPLFS